MGRRRLPRAQVEFVGPRGRPTSLLPSRLESRGILWNDRALEQDCILHNHRMASAFSGRRTLVLEGSLIGLKGVVTLDECLVLGGFEGSQSFLYHSQRTRRLEPRHC